MPELPALDIPLDTDLRAFSLHLWRHGLQHRITEAGGRQVLWVQSNAELETVRDQYRRWLSGELEIQSPEAEELPKSRPRPIPFARLPVTLLLVLGSILGALVVTFSQEWTLALSFFRFEIQGERAAAHWPVGQYWRLITPIFLHYGILHLAFNALWTWELGRRIELMQGSVFLLGVTLLTGVGSNLAQAMYSVSLFGGMSGVIYGLLGYCAVWSRLRPSQSFQLPQGIVIFMIGWLLVCMAGFTELLGLGKTANAAHVGGLVMGALLGAAAALMAPRPGKS